MTIKEVLVPDLGGATDVDVIEVHVKPGDEVTAEQSLITLEGDKATMEIPAPFAGKVKELKVAVGNKVSQGSVILTLEVAEAGTTTAPAAEKPAKTSAPETVKPAAATSQEVRIPDIGGATQVDVIEVMVKPGDQVAKEQALITLEGDKATMEIPSPFAGEVKSVAVKVGNKVSQGDLILTLSVTGANATTTTAEKSAPQTTAPLAPAPAKAAPAVAAASATPVNIGDVHAGPGVRKIAREFGVDLTRVRGHLLDAGLLVVRLSY